MLYNGGRDKFNPSSHSTQRGRVNALIINVCVCIPEYKNNNILRISIQEDYWTFVLNQRPAQMSFNLWKIQTFPPTPPKKKNVKKSDDGNVQSYRRVRVSQRHTSRHCISPFLYFSMSIFHFPLELDFQLVLSWHATSGQSPLDPIPPCPGRNRFWMQPCCAPLFFPFMISVI
jgi:hypothetical protein